MPGVYIEFIKAGKFVVPVELSFQTETIRANKSPSDINASGFVSTSKWIERHNWKEIRAMLKPAVEACLKYHDTTLECIPKSDQYQIRYGREVSLGYLIVPNRVSTPFLSILDPKKNCWTDDEDDEDELLGLKDNNSNTLELEDHGAEFTECIPTKTAIRVCVVRKSVVSIDDARRIRKELGVRSEDVRHYLSAAAAEPGSSSSMDQFQENFDREKGVSEWAAGNSMYSQGSSTNQPSSVHELDDHEPLPLNDLNPLTEEESSDEEVENIPRTFGDLEEIRDTARIYNHLLKGHEVDSGEDPDDDLSLPDIEPDPPKKKKEPIARKKSASVSPSKSKRLSQNNILSVTQEGQANFSEEESTFTKKPTKRSKRKRTVAVVEPMRTLPNGQVSFEQAIGALGSDKRRKPRPGSSHGTDKAHTGGGRSKQTPAIDIIAPDDDRLTITTPPDPIPVITPEPIRSTSISSPTKEFDELSDLESRMNRSKKKRRIDEFDDESHKWERLTPSPLFDDDDKEDDDLSDDDAMNSLCSDSDLEMPVLIKMVDSDEERREQSLQQNVEEPKEDKTPVKTSEPAEEKSKESEEEETVTPALDKAKNDQCSPDITKIKTIASRKQFSQGNAATRKLYEPQVQPEGLVKSINHPSIPKESQPQQSASASNVGETVTNEVEKNESGKDGVQQKQSATSEETPLPERPKSLQRRSVREKLNFSEIQSGSEGRTPTPTKANTSLFEEIAKGVLQRKDKESEEKPQRSVTKNSTTSERTQSPSLRSRSPALPKNSSSSNAMAVTNHGTMTENASGPGPVTNGRIEIEVERKKVVKKKFKKRMRKTKPVSSEAIKAKEKPVMGDAQTQTDDCFIIADIKRTTPTVISAAQIKVSRSCEASSDDELYDTLSQRSKTPASETSASNVQVYHPAVGSPTGDYYDEDRLFSFESPVVPSLSLNQTTLVPKCSPEFRQNSSTSTIENHEESFEDHGESEMCDLNLDQEKNLEDGGSLHSQNNQQEQEVIPEVRPESPQPGCSYWPTPTRRSPSPPPPTLRSSILMPPPTSRPPRTPRKLPGKKRDDNSPPRLSISSPEHMLPQFHDYNDDDCMPVGAEAMNISNKGSIYQVLNQPEVFAAGLKLIDRVSKTPSSVSAIGRKLNLEEAEASDGNGQAKALVPVPQKRPPSPDICDIVPVPDKRLRVVISTQQSRRNTLDDGRNSDVEGNDEGLANAASLRRTNDDELSDIDGSALDYFQRSGNAATEYQPQGDEFDLSQRSYCMLTVVPQYDVKSRLYKIHAKACREMPTKKLVEHFNAIKQDLLGVFQGNVFSNRHKKFLQGFNGKLALRDMNISSPFTGEQCSTIATLIYDNIFPDPSMRCEYIDYVTLVLLPEALIRIFVRINNVPYNMAETEMRFRACYDGDLPETYRQNAIPSPTAPELEFE